MPRFPKSRTYNNTFYCSPCGLPEELKVNLVLIPITKWCKQNHYTKAQARTLLRKKKLLGCTYKGKMFVTENPYAIWDEY